MRVIVTAWGLLGVVALLSQAVVRLGARALTLGDAWDTLTPVHLAALVGCVAFMAYGEGWRGFHQRFSPRVVVRAGYLMQAPWWAKVLAPMTCMGLIWAAPRRQKASWGILTGIIGLIVAVRFLPFPWREIVDAGVVVGLSVGLASLAWHGVRAWMGSPPDVDPELPEGVVAQGVAGA